MEQISIYPRLLEFCIFRILILVTINEIIINIFRTRNGDEVFRKVNKYLLDMFVIYSFLRNCGIRILRVGGMIV